MERRSFIFSGYFILSLVSILFNACIRSARTPYQEALDEAGSHRDEWEKVIAHYAQTGDTLRQRAAIFLIGNMLGKGTYQFTGKEDILNYVASQEDPIGWEGSGSILNRTLDSVIRSYRPRAIFHPDLRTLSSDLLIRQIDAAFESWSSQPWKQDYSFEDFCEWVLPYRTSSEEIEEWRSAALDCSIEREDSVRDACTLFDYAAQLINHTGLRYNIGMAKYPFPMTVTEMQRIKRGSCAQMSDYAVKFLRSRGIPAAVDITPAWANSSSNHMWNVIVYPNGRSVDIGYNPGGKNDFAHKMVKVYRNTYSIQRNSAVYRFRDTETIPPFFGQFNKLDVTSQYGIPLTRLTVCRLDSTRSKLAYLATFNNYEIWSPVAYSEIIDNRAVFANVGRGIMPPDKKLRKYDQAGAGVVFLPCYYIRNRLVPAGTPAIVSEEGTVRTLKPDFNRLQTVTLLRKYPEQTWLARLRHRMKGCRFEAANREDFQDAEVIYTIDHVPEFAYEKQDIESTDKEYRYIRFVANSVETDHDIASLAVYSGNEKLRGVCIDRAGFNARNATVAFDDDILSYYRHYRDDATSKYVGIDLQVPRKITAVSYASRTDDNEIVRGDVYELFYWDNRWQSAGRKQADGNRLVYDHIPDNALLLLRNLTKGVEERIFTYDNDQQIWW